VLTTNAALSALGPEWDALWQRAQISPRHATFGTTPFQSPAWLLPWWAAFGTGRPCVAILRGDGGSLLGLLPLYLLDENGARKLLPIGVGITDYHDALLSPGVPAHAAAALLGAALESGVRNGMTICDLPDLPPGALLRDVAAPAGWREERWAGSPCPVLVLPDDPAALREAVPSGTLRKLRMARRRAERLGGWTAAVAGAEQVASSWDTLVRLHRARWTRRGEAGGVLADPRVLEFHRVALPRLFDTGALRLHALYLGNMTAAVYYALTAGPDRLLFYLSGFNESHAFESPGTILLGHIVDGAIAEGRRELHFLRGGEAYKYAWGGQDRMNIGRRLLPPNSP
jgi:CelD/BcsL family acetyltransferase involved in cellulose biosynthesis